MAKPTIVNAHPMYTHKGYVHYLRPVKFVDGKLVHSQTDKEWQNSWAFKANKNPPYIGIVQDVSTRPDVTKVNKDESPHTGVD